MSEPAASAADDLHHVMSGRGFECAHCQANTEELNELFQLTQRLWRYLAIVDDRLASQPVLCVGCVESVLGRPLGADDFEASPLHLLTFTHSDRLRSRLSGATSTQFNSPQEGAA